LRLGGVNEADALVARGKPGANVREQNIGTLPGAVERAHVGAGTDVNAGQPQLHDCQLDGRRLDRKNRLGREIGIGLGTTEQENPLGRIRRR
jgi:hypothetical protein